MSVQPASRSYSDSETPSFEDFFGSTRGRRLLTDVKRLAGRDGDDIAQEVLVWAWLRWARFENENHVVFACVRFARNRVVDRARSFEQRRVALCDEVPSNALGTSADPADTVVRLDECRERWNAFRRLPATSQELLLRRAEGASYDEIAIRFRMSPAASRVQVCRSRAAVRLLLRPHASPLLLLPGRVLACLRRAARALTDSSIGAVNVTAGLAALATASALVPVLAPTGTNAVAPDARPAIRVDRDARPELVGHVEADAVEAPRAANSGGECAHGSNCAEAPFGSRTGLLPGVLPQLPVGGIDLDRCLEVLRSAQKVDAASPYTVRVADLDILTGGSIAAGGLYYSATEAITARIPDFCPPGLTTALRIDEESPGHSSVVRAPITRTSNRRDVHQAVTTRPTMLLGIGAARAVSVITVYAAAAQSELGWYFCRVYRYTILVGPAGGVDVVPRDVDDCPTDYEMSPASQKE